MRQHRLRMIITLSLMTMMIISCKEEGVKLPTKANIYFSVVGKKVAFTALTINAETFLWDFGDGTTSDEKNPVHYYEAGGTYIVKLTVTGPTGSDEAAVEVSVALSPYEMLTGGPQASNGKTWRISSQHSSKDAFTLADPTMTVIQPIAAGMLGEVGLGLPEVYEDEFTFYYDGSYGHDVKGDGAAFAGLVHTLMNGLQIANMTEVSQQFGLCTTKYVPEAGAKFTYTESKDLTVTAVTETNGYGDVTYSGVSTLSFTGTEFIGFMDAMSECIIQEITNDKMRLAIFVSASPDYYPVKTHVIILTFEVVK